MNSKCIYKSVRSIKAFCTIALLMASAMVYAADATQEPLLYSSDMTYVGSFKLPTPTSGRFGYGGMGLSVSADGKSLYVGGHVYDQSLGLVEIPNPIGGTAKLIKSPVNIPGNIGGACGSGPELSGTLVYNGRLIIQKRCYYDTNGVGVTHLVGDLSISNFKPMSLLGNLPSKQFGNGYMGLIPQEWQSLLGGPAFSGNSSMSIISLCSNGPSVFAFNPDDVGVKSPIPSIPLMYFPEAHPVADPDKGNDIWSRADQENAGLVFPSGTRSLLFFSKHGYGDRTYKVADGCGGEAGEAAGPYRRQVTAFDANDLLAVKNGTKQPWEIRPYAWWVLPGPSDTCASFRPAGLAYDPLSRRVFGTFKYGESSTIHVWQISGEPGTAPPVLAAPSPPHNVEVQ